MFCVLASSIVCLWINVHGAASHAASIEDYRLHNFEVGGDFVLTDQFGVRTSLADFSGKVVVLFFGFTNCPDVCPTTMVDMTSVLKSLGERSASVRVVFITVDPERDTQEQLKTYLGYFHAAIIGLTGTEEEIAEAANGFDTRFRRQSADDEGYYSVDHTSFIYILDPKGETRYVIPYNIGAERILEGVLSLLGTKE